MASITHVLSGLTQAERDALSQVPTTGGATWGGPAPRPAVDRYPLSFAQQRLWIVEQVAPGTPAYHITLPVRLRGPIDVGHLADGLHDVIQRHAVLRASFPAEQGTPAQVFRGELRIDLPLIDIGAEPDASRHDAFQQHIEQIRRQPFDLAQGPLLRAALVRVAAMEHVLVIVLHHLVADGWSLAILAEELSGAYQARLQRVAPAWHPLALQYGDYVLWQRERVSGEQFADQLEFWKRQLTGMPVLDLPTDFPRPAVQTFRGATRSATFPPGLAASCRASARRSGLTFFMLSLGALSAVLHRWTGQTRLAIGTPIMGRPHPSLEPLIGFFANTLALPIDLTGDPAGDALLRRVREVCLTAYEHQDVPFERLVDELHPSRDPGRNPLFQVMLALQNTPAGRIAANGVELSTVSLQGSTAKFDLWLSIDDRGAAPAVLLEYNTDLFRADSADRLLRHFFRALEALVADTPQPISRLPLAAAPVPPPTDDPALLGRTLVHEWLAQVARTPERVALRCEDEQWTYRGLQFHALRVAAALRHAGVGRGTLVGICAERSLEMVAGLLGIWIAGAAYVPLDPEYPPQRIAYMLDDAAVHVVCLQQRWRGLMSAAANAITILDLETIVRDTAWDERSGGLPLPPHPDDLAYVIYTSGSTGKSKGAMNAHGAVSNRILWMQRAYDLEESDRILQKTSCGFDVSVWEFFWPLVTGACLVLARPGEHRNPKYLAEVIERERITTIHFVPSMLKAALDDIASCTTLRRVICSGEALPASLARDFRAASAAALHNLYGPTEAAIDVSAWDCSQPSDTITVPIGHPIANCALHVLDPRLEAALDGLPGELYIGGAAVCHGYVGRPALTAERFLPDPFASRSGARLYRTGDRVRQLPGGEIEFLGRTDHQLKIRGHRIEPEEIERVIGDQPGVAEAVVVGVPGLGDNPARLAAFVVPAHRETESPTGDLLTAWTQVWSETYAQGLTSADPRLDTIGWNSRSDRRRFADDEMSEWADATAARILSWNPARVLEIGCGAGLILCRVRPACSRYVATDVAASAIERLRANLARVRDDGQGPPAHLVCASALDLSALEEERFDTVIFNSVVQYFPGLPYLETALRVAIDRLHEGGRIFIGDVRHAGLRGAFFAATHLANAPANTPVAEVRAAVDQSLRLDQELAVAPAYFQQLRQRLPRLRHVEVLVKRGTRRNELTDYRYDVMLHCDRQPHVIAPSRWETWQAGDDLAALMVRAKDQQARAMGIRGIANSRVLADVRAAASLNESPALECASDVRRLAATAARGGVHPEEACAAAADLGFAAALRWPADRADGAFDLLCHTAAWPSAVPESDTEAIDAIDPDGLANDPVRGAADRALIDRLRHALRENLPAYMVPSAFLLLPAIPRNAHGKIDRRALPAVSGAPIQTGRYVAPATRVERALADIWSRVLGRPDIGIHDNFFELGGDSILAIQVIARANAAGLPFAPRHLFQHQTIAELAESVPAPAAEQPSRQARGLQCGYRGFMTAEEREAYRASPDFDDLYPLGPRQGAMWQRYVQRPEPGLYIVQNAIPLQADVDGDALQRAWQLLVDREAVLRTSFVHHASGGPLQRVHRQVPVHLPYEDWGDRDDREDGTLEWRLSEVLRIDRARPWELSHPEPVRLRLIRVGGGACFLMVTFNYICIDGWTYDLLLARLFSMYERCVSGTPTAPPDQAPYSSYFDWLARCDLTRAEEYWRSALRDCPTGSCIGEVGGGAGLHDRACAAFDGAGQDLGQQWRALSPEITTRLSDVTRQRRISAATLAQAAWARTLATRSGREDVLFGIGSTGRPAELAGVEQIAGRMMTALPLCLRVPNDRASSVDWLAQLQDQVVSMRQFEYLPYERVMECGNLPSSFESYMMFQNLSSRRRNQAAPGITLASGRRPTPFFVKEEHPLRIDVLPGAELTCVMTYHRSRFETSTITALLDDLMIQFERLSRL